MRQLPQSLFDIYILSLPRGHGFGENAPVEAWETEDHNSCGIVTSNVHDKSFGVLVMRRRTDFVWKVVNERFGLASREIAREVAYGSMKEGAPLERIPPGVSARPPLHDLQGHPPTSIHKLLFSPTHHRAAWLMNQVYVALPNPDANWATDFHSGNFHTRIWELHLLAAFREQGLLVSQPFPSPDFRIENRKHGVGWVEAVTANPPEPYDHVNSKRVDAPDDTQEKMIGPAALRFAKTIGSKLQRGYSKLPHVTGMPFAIALADFHAPGSMVWSRNALMGYLYGIALTKTSVESGQRPSLVKVETLMGSTFPAGLFSNAQHAELSAVIFTNTCTTAKFNRVAISAGATVEDYRYVRMGEFFDRNSNAFKGIPFCLDITSPEYHALWPQGYEPWGADVEVFHNPHANYPLPDELLPELTHWHEIGGEIQCAAHYKTSILYSNTLVLDKEAPLPSIDDIIARSFKIMRANIRIGTASWTNSTLIESELFYA